MHTLFTENAREQPANNPNQPMGIRLSLNLNNELFTGFRRKIAL